MIAGRKYKNQPQVVGSETYRSKREMRRHQELLLLERAGRIRELQREVPFELAPKVKIDGEDRARPALRYMADYVYIDADGRLVVEDSKGMSTDVFRLKKHLMKSVHGIDVREV